VRRSIDNQSHLALENMYDLFLRMLVRWHFAAGVEAGEHLIHRLAACNGLAFDPRANLNPRIFVFHDFTSIQRF
jgi:hypothetical protein